MPYDDPDPTDPMTLHGVAVETDSNAANLEMAACFVDELLRLGFTTQRILQVFQTRGYAGPYLAYEMFGAEAIKALIAEHAQRRGSRQNRYLVERTSGGNITLPVLD